MAGCWLTQVSTHLAARRKQEQQCMVCCHHSWRLAELSMAWETGANPKTAVPSLSDTLSCSVLQVAMASTV